MLHPSYTELLKLVNEESGAESPVINSRYSIVMATSKRARQIIAGEAHVTEQEAQKPLSTAVAELKDGLIRIVPEDADTEDEHEIERLVDRFVEENVPTEDEARRIIEERAEEEAKEEN
jgi:DNA-directed RNA polymerase subunit omega